jgi:TATA-box binding protein (TBP) (component of TFIID and TFIIIB)
MTLLKNSFIILKEILIIYIKRLIMEKIRNEILEDFELFKLPEDVNISTMTIVCKLGTKFNNINIAKFMHYKFDPRIITAKKTRMKKVDKNSKKVKVPRKLFYNQLSYYIRVPSKEKKPIHAKLFSNGSMQFSGCKKIENVLEALAILMEKFKTIYSEIDYKNNKIIERPFVEDISKLSFEYISNFRIVMINSNFDINFKIDREKLYNVLRVGKYDCRYDPQKHACVNIKHVYNDKIISIFVFEKGKIIITGANNCDHILSAYNFINKYLLQNYVSIVENCITIKTSLKNFIH